eukprot:206090-Hanusia_phi.AAC.1
MQGDVCFISVLMCKVTTGSSDRKLIEVPAISQSRLEACETSLMLPGNYISDIPGERGGGGGGGGGGILIMGRRRRREGEREERGKEEGKLALSL